MSFLDTYVKKYRLDKISDKAKTNLNKLEVKLDQITRKAKKGLTFLGAMKKYGNEVGDLIERVSLHFDDLDFSIKGTFSTFQFVYSIATEVYQIMELMKGEVIPVGLSEEKAWGHQLKFGKEMIYFIWMTVDPLKKKFNWIPFKKTIEKRLVMWIGGMGLESARRFFKANEKEVEVFSANNSISIMKAL